MGLAALRRELKKAFLSSDDRQQKRREWNQTHGIPELRAQVEQAQRSLSDCAFVLGNLRVGSVVNEYNGRVNALIEQYKKLLEVYDSKYVAMFPNGEITELSIIGHIERMKVLKNFQESYLSITALQPVLVDKLAPILDTIGQTKERYRAEAERLRAGLCKTTQRHWYTFFRAKTRYEIRSTIVPARRPG